MTIVSEREKKSFDEALNYGREIKLPIGVKDLLKTEYN